MQNLTPGQKISLNLFLSSYDDTRSFEKLLGAIEYNDFTAFEIWDEVRYMNDTTLIETISNLSIEIDTLLKNK
ncbi:MAG: hypothetical protein NTZ67_08085 [Gammaproteobacteria bacterium]|nr:hypothetical protein [Gammaproteobacteria bacterium]